eukprot:1133221-Pelagomonas_calceolata.AAC.2
MKLQAIRANAAKATAQNQGPPDEEKMIGSGSKRHAERCVPIATPDEERMMGSGSKRHAERCVRMYAEFIVTCSATALLPATLDEGKLIGIR